MPKLKVSQRTAPPDSACAYAAVFEPAPADVDARDFPPLRATLLAGRDDP